MRKPFDRLTTVNTTVERIIFKEQLDDATRQAVEFARRYVIQTLADKVAFKVYPNESCDENPLTEDEVVFPEDKLSKGRFHGPWSAEQAVQFLWREGKVPEWIDIAVEDARTDLTIIMLRCCGRFTAREDLLYYNFTSGKSPFGIKSPSLPPWWNENSGKFSLHWRTRNRFSNAVIRLLRRLCS
jgi:hypothetical protein